MLLCSRQLHLSLQLLMFIGQTFCSSEETVHGFGIFGIRMWQLRKVQLDWQVLFRRDAIFVCIESAVEVSLRVII